MPSIALQSAQLKSTQNFSLPGRQVCDSFVNPPSLRKSHISVLNLLFRYFSPIYLHQYVFSVRFYNLILITLETC